MNPSVVSKTTLFAIKKEINEFEENQNPSEGVPVIEEFVALTGVNTGSNSVMQESAGAAAKTNEVVPASLGPGESAKNNETDVSFADGVNGLGRKSPTASTVVRSKPCSNLLGADHDSAAKGCSTVTSVREVGEKGKNCDQPNGVRSSSVVNTEKNSGGSEDSSKKPLICRVCKEKFIEAGLLDAHYKDVHKMSDPYQCWRCDYLTSAYRCMERHMEFCGSDTPFPCIECNRTFKNAAGVTLHMVRAHSKVSADKDPDPKTGTNSTFACMECGDMFGTVELLAVHYIRSHAKDFVVMSNEATNELRCSKCSAFFDNKDLLLKHKIETHSKDLRVVVPKLKVVYADSRRKKMKKTDEGDEGSDAAAGATKSEAAAKKTTRLRPRKVRPIVKEGDEIEAENGTGDEDWEFKKDETGYLCPYFDKGCLYKNAKKRNLQRHLQSKHSDESSAVYTCPFKESGCTYEAHHRDLVRKHAKIHNKNYTCDSCDFACSKKKELKCHRLDVHGISWRPRHLCPICGREFKNNPKLQIHLRVHRNDRPFICDQCAKCFTCTAMLKTHQNVKHGNKKYACPTCGKEFPIKQYLNKHLRTHNNDKPFLCEICSKGFKTGSHLKAHVRMHTGEKPYECKECGKRFKQICGLHAHQKVHTGEKPYVCTECSRAFTYYSSLKGGLCSQCQREDRKAPKATENVKEETVEVDV